MAARRVVRHYLVLASAADLAAMGDRMRLAAHDDVVRSKAQELGKTAFAALDAERHNLVGVLAMASERELFAEVWQLCEALWPYFLNRKHLRDWTATTRLGVAAARAAGDPAAEARMRSQLARALSEQGSFDDAEEELRQAAELADRGGDPRLTASVAEFTGKLHRDRGDHDRAVPHLRRALRIFTEIGRTRGAAIQRHAIAQALHLSGDHEGALAEAGLALAAFEELDADPRNVGNVQLTRATVLAAVDRPEEALTALRSAVELLEQADAVQLQARAVELMAELDAERAAAHLATAAALYLRAGDDESADRLRSPRSPAP
ncbi:tetratricopeptide repeat protein [Nocardia sp. NRRL S-836]|uniref:tetratricopeptide repeat protein n=1 Tax=Nocardia sp. NRRL S-836 TaxID=1519492 RepID=UPI0006ADFA86|nr:tetratricopeptide repeat protein [Nocardia sp. NRRL S-836]KOV82870.1 hypothetical protein ADL03_22610 [Nocardia sp. NRRL S-836]